MTHLRIAMIGQRGVPATYGGVERHVEELGRRLAERGHHVVVYVRPGYSDVKRDSFDGMRLVETPTIPSKHLDAMLSSAAATLKVLREPVDIVHYHAIGPGGFSFLPRFFTRKQIVQTIHGLDADRDKWGAAAGLYLRGATWMSARVPHKRIVVSRALQRYYQLTYDSESTYIPNGVTAPEIRPPGLCLESLGLDPGKYLLFVGRLVPEKRPELLIEAFRGMDTEMKLVVVGGSSFSDSYVEMLHELAANDDRVVLPGYMFGSELGEIYTNAAAFVTPSALEGLPLTLLEAIGAGLPIVASDIPPHLEVLPDSGAGGRTFAVDDVDALRSALKHVLFDNDAERQGAALITEKVLDHYHWAEAASQLETLYLELLEGKSTSRLASRDGG
jgi:glycosyltransferase involved in cell wall biosynthesis